MSFVGLPKGLKWFCEDKETPSKPGLKCPRCGNIKSMYNPGKLCLPCCSAVVLAGGDPDKWKKRR